MINRYNYVLLVEKILETEEKIGTIKVFKILRERKYLKWDMF